MLFRSMKADLAVVDMSVVQWHPIHDVLVNLVYSASGSDVVLTMVDGKVLYKDGECVKIDEEKVVFEVAKATKRILNQL